MLLSDKALYLSDFTTYKKKEALLEDTLVYKSEHEHAKISQYFRFRKFDLLVQHCIISLDLYNTIELPVVLRDKFQYQYNTVPDEVLEYVGSYLELMLAEHGWNVVYQNGTLMFR